MAAAVSYAEGVLAIFNVRLDDDLASRFDSWAAVRGGRSAALRQLLQGATKGVATAPRVQGRADALPVKLTVRLSAADALGLAVAASEVGLTRNAWVAAMVRRRLSGRPTFSPAEALSILVIQSELRRIGVNINQIARALNTAVLGGRILDLELTYLDELRGEIRAHLHDLRQGLAGNLAYWDVDM